MVAYAVEFGAWRYSVLRGRTDIYDLTFGAHPEFSAVTARPGPATSLISLAATSAPSEAKPGFRNSRWPRRNACVVTEECPRCSPHPLVLHVFVAIGVSPIIVE